MSFNPVKNYFRFFVYETKKVWYLLVTYLLVAHQRERKLMFANWMFILKILQALTSFV